MSNTDKHRRTINLKSPTAFVLFFLSVGLVIGVLIGDAIAPDAGSTHPGPTVIKFVPSGAPTPTQ